MREVAWNPAETSTCATASDDGMVKLWCAARRAQLAAARVGGATRAVAFSPDGTTLACGLASGEVVVLDARTLRPLPGAPPVGSTSVPRAGERGVSALAFSPGGDTLAAAGADRCVHLFDCHRG